MIQFIDDFQSCSRTYATLCLYHSSETTSVPIDLLGIQPDSTVEDETVQNGWFWSSRAKVESRDCRRHIIYVLDSSTNLKESLIELRSLGWVSRNNCFWESSTGNGGPILDNDFVKILSSYDVDLHFDVWWDLS